MATAETTTITEPTSQTENPAGEGIKLQGGAGEVQETPDAPIKVFAFQYPPFPPKPEGKVIIPFKDFKPKGVIPADSDDEEFDAEGVKTVRLPVKHIPDPEERAAYERAKRARKRRRGNQGAGLGPASKKREDGPMKAWFDEWEDDRYRERITPMPPHAPREERFTQIMVDFQTDRTFPRSIQSVHDNFRIFCGLLEQVHNPPGSKRARRKKKAASDHEMDGPGEDQEPEADADGELEPGEAAELSTDDEEVTPSPAPKIEEVAEEEETTTKRSGFGGKPPKAVPWSNGEKMDRFLDNPEAMLKLFFSHYSYERGMIWDVEKRRYAPFLIKFILEYIIRHGTMKEMKADFERALKIVERAKIEQPAVGEIADIIPDSFHIACREHFGRWDIGMWGSGEDTNWADNANVDPDVPPLPADGWGAVGSSKTGLVTDEDLQKEGMSIDPAANDGWNLPAEVVADPLDEGSSDGEAPPAPAEAAAAAAATVWDVGPSWEAAKLPALTDFYPAAPEDMKIIRVEHSVRQILSIEPPNANSASDFRKPVGVITLVPWPRHHDDVMTYTPYPKIDKEDFTDIPSTPPHDPLKDTIRLLASPETIEKLSERLGMGINGYWVQVAKKNTESKDTTEGPPAAKKKKKGKSVDPDSPQHFWYLETSTQILQTYWTEPDDLIVGLA